MVAYYNEFDKYAAQWLRNLIKARHIADGDVDERSIVDVQASDLKGYTQCHFFAGIGGWSYALRLAGWNDSRPVWTGSCPCQPFSQAGKHMGRTDERHLWPAWFSLIRKLQPPRIFGEQVAAAIAKGWLDDVAQDLEMEKYSFGSAVLPAISVGAPHKRDRLWFVAHAKSNRRNGQVFTSKGKEIPGLMGSSKNVANTNKSRLQGRNEGKLQECADKFFVGASNTSKLHTGWEPEPSVGRVANGVLARAHKLRAYGNAIVPQVAAEFIRATM